MNLNTIGWGEYKSDSAGLTRRGWVSSFFKAVTKLGKKKKEPSSPRVETGQNPTTPGFNGYPEKVVQKAGWINLPNGKPQFLKAGDVAPAGWRNP